MKKHILLLFVFTTILAKAQDNIFLQRSFWKTNPSIEKIDQLIKEGNNVAELNINAFDGVIYAILEKTDNKTIKYLLSKRGNGANKMTHDGRTYLFWAAYKNNLEIMQHLLDNGAKTNVIDDHGNTVMTFAASTGNTNTKLYDMCLNWGADLNKETNHDGANSLLLVAPSLKDTSLIEYFISKGINLKATDNKGNGLFNYAAKTGNKVILEYAVDKKLDYKNLTKEDGNAMLFASRGIRNYITSLDTYKYLENLGVKPNVVTNTGTTPLHGFARREKNIEVYNYFLSKGVDIDQPNADGNTAFTLAARSNNLAIVTFLHGKIKNINHKNKKGETALSNAINSNSIDVVEYLLKNGADLNITNQKGQGLGYYLTQSFQAKKPNSFYAKAKLLADHGFDFQQTQENGNTLYHIAIEKNNIDLLKWVHKQNVDVNLRNKENLTALQKAVMIAKDDKVIKLLILLGANTKVKTEFDETLYDLAKENELLKKNDIDIQFLK